MKIIYLHQYFKFPNEAGATRSFDLARGFNYFGHNVEIVTSTSQINNESKRRWNKVKKNGLTVHYIFLPYENEMNYYQRSIVFFKFLWFSTFKLLSLKGDVVLATSTPLTIGIPALIKKWIHNTPFIFETRDVWPEVVIAIGAIKNKIIQKILYLLESLIYKNASAVVALSVDMKHSITSRYPRLTNKPIEVIENISEIDRFQNGYNNKISLLKSLVGFKPRFTILYAGTFGHVNGIDYVIELASKLIKLDPGIVFLLVGDGAKKKEVTDKALKKGVLDNNVFISESVSKLELPQLYFECDIGSSFVVPVKELWSNSANKFFDTLAAGKPILINYEGWQKEVINKENIGYVLPCELNDIEVEKFLSYSKKEKLILEQQKNSLNIAKKYYSQDLAVSKYNKLLIDIFNF